MKVLEPMRLYKKSPARLGRPGSTQGGRHRPDKHRTMMMCVIAIRSAAITACDSLPHPLPDS